MTHHSLDELTSEELASLPKSIEEAAELEAERLPKHVQNQWRRVKVYAYLSGEHNPIHGYKVDLSSGQ
jgi:hypothetical protein